MYVTTDLWFASFLKLKGYELSDYEVIKRGKANFMFSISDDDCKKLKLEFMKDYISEVKQTYEQLKDMGF